jgi:hypothetical protein
LLSSGERLDISGVDYLRLGVKMDTRKIHELLSAAERQIVHVTKPLNAEAVVLAGSYGRGEGAWYIGTDGKIQPYNDFDIVLIEGKKSINTQAVMNAEISLKKKLNIKWVDIDILKKRKMTSLPTRIKYYDLKYGSKVLYGDLNILKQLPHYLPSDINYPDVKTLLFTRLWPFMGSLPFNGFQAKLSSTELRFFNYQMAKAILASVDAILISQGSYDHSYSRRHELISKVIDHSRLGDMELISWAFGQKANPTPSENGEDYVRNFYNTVHNFFVRTMTQVIVDIKYHKMEDLREFMELWENEVKQIVLRAANRLLWVKPAAVRRYLMKKAELNLLLAYNYVGDQHKNYLIACYKIIFKNFDYNGAVSWEEMRLHCAKIRI